MNTVAYLFLLVTVFAVFAIFDVTAESSAVIADPAPLSRSKRGLPFVAIALAFLQKILPLIEPVLKAFAPALAAHLLSLESTLQLLAAL